MPAPLQVVAPASAEQAGVPAFAQAGTSSRSKRRASTEEEENPGAKPAKRKLRGCRRKQNDYWPVPRGNEAQDVKALREWTQRGSCKPAQRMIDFRGRRVDVEEAWRVLEREGASVSGPPQMAPFTAAPQMPDYLQTYPQQGGSLSFSSPDSSSSLPVTMPQGMDFLPGALPAQPLRFENPFDNPAAQLSPQQMGMRDPFSFLSLQASMPAYQPAPAPAPPQQSGYLQAENLEYDPSLKAAVVPPLDTTPGDFSFAAGPVGIQDDLEFASVDGVSWVEASDTGPIMLIPVSPEENERIMRIEDRQQRLGRGAEGLQMQTNAPVQACG